eukprot:TRINITY_DN2527_c0_g1_i1.p1 TRINITY_DN2527_c0_g1~~TRINITY_DN2527_c0_g1_i1.p1  ORF type:complete len:368 (+),score=35.32 TRINITY_DN2527_c0_g1_i1:236-1339(+)
MYQTSKRCLEDYSDEEVQASKRSNVECSISNNESDSKAIQAIQQPQLAEKCVHYWFTILLNEEDMKSSISVLKHLPTLKNLARVCKLLSKPVRAYLSNNYWFSQENLSFTWHSPKKLKAVTNLSLINSNHAHLLTHITLGYYFSQSIDGLLPPNVLQLTCGYHFNVPIFNLPSKITHITFGSMFCKEQFTLPPSVTHVNFGTNFNCAISDKNLQYSKVTHVRFGYEFSRVIEPGSLPRTLTHLAFGFKFNKPLAEGSLPPNLLFLQFGFEYNQRTDTLPSSIQTIIFGWQFSQPVDNLPINLTHLEFGYRFDRPVENLPKSLSHLKFGYSFNREVCSLPQSIRYLEFGGRFSQNVHHLPKDIAQLTF